jgi:membrane protease YdiL (CAAX protease family)
MIWLVIAAAIFARVFRPEPGPAPVSRIGGARCLVGAVLGVAMLALVLWSTSALPPLVRAIAGLCAHLGIAAFLLAYAAQVEPGRDVLGIVPPRWSRDLLRGIGAYVVFIPIVAAAHVANEFIIGKEVESVQKGVHETLTGAGPERTALILNVTLAVPLLEELLFRGLLQQGLKAQLAVVVAPRPAAFLSVVIASIAFTGLHETATYIPVFVLSLILGASFEWSGRILVPVALHGAHNLAVVLLKTVAPEWGGGP